MLAKAPPGESTECEFRTTQPLTLWPIEIAEARLTGIPPDIQGLERYVPAQVSVQGALRLRLRLTHDVKFSQLAGLDRLPIYL
ncbi:type VI secretion system baseplate subunit TssF, partial [Escherichia coli]|uniref:type VI secretion system baseplate subunit TssF n=1 Tax=Escherichia coli TaxID=562 RepID=UPI00207C2B33